MASEELQVNEAPTPTPASLPPYPEMILTAIKELNESNGSNKSAITKCIEGTYGALHPAQSALLTHHLNTMKSAGQLHFIKNNYLIPEPNSPPRRGRGRPPKPKTPLSPGAVTLSPRPRGRPPKSRDPTAPPQPEKATASTVSGRKRGRPPKANKAGVSAASPPPEGGVPRGRGRPPKVKPAVAAPVGA